MPSYGVMEIHSAAVFWQKRARYHADLKDAKPGDVIRKATAETAAKYGDETLAKLVAVYVVKGKLHGEWKIGS